MLYDCDMSSLKWVLIIYKDIKLSILQNNQNCGGKYVNYEGKPVQNLITMFVCERV